MGGKIGDISNLKKGKRIAVGGLTDLTIVRKIGEGGSAFVYTARRSNSAVAARQSSTSALALRVAQSPAPISDSASVAGYNVAGSHLGDEDGVSVMSYAPGDGSNLTPSRRRSRRSRFFSASKTLRNLPSSSLTRTDGKAGTSDLVVIKATSTSGSPTRKRQAEKEIEVLLRLRNRRHPNIVQILDWTSVKCSTTSNALVTLCAMEYCAGGSLMDLISGRRERLLAERALRQKSGGKSSPGPSTEMDENAATATNGNGNKFLRKLKRHAGSDGSDDEIPPPPPPIPVPQLIGDAGNQTSEAYFDYEDILSIFQQVSSAIRFLHSSFDIRPLVHRDIKPENILLIPTNINQMETILPGMHRWTVRLCDFGSVVEGNQSLRTPTDRRAAEDIIQKSTTQMYRAPEMVNVHSVQELTAKTDVWALGCSLYMACYLQNCFEENSSLAILSGNYLDPPDDHPYSQTSLHELIDRMLTVNVPRRAGIEDVCKCLDRLIAGRGLPKRPSGRQPKKLTSVSTPSPKKVGERRPVASAARASPPPPPPPPRPSKQNTQKQTKNISNSIPSSVFVDRRSARTQEHAREPLGDCDLLAGEKILMQSVPEDTAMRSHRDPRKNYGRNHPDTTASLPIAMNVDHIYNDLLHDEPTKRSGKKSKRKPTSETRRTDDSLSLEDELDRIRIFTSSDKVEVKATDGSDSVSFESTPPLTPIEMSSIASLSSEDHYSFSRESPARRKKGRDPPGTQGRASVQDPPGTT